MKDDYKRLLRAAKELRGWDGPQEIADGLTLHGYPVSAQKIGNWKSRGVSKEAKLSAAPIIGYRPAWLDTGEGDMEDTLLPSSNRKTKSKGAESIHENVEPGPDIKGRIPLISWVKAGMWSEAVDIYEPGYAERWLPVLKTNGQHIFALRVEGDSMTAKYGKSYPDGCIIFVDPDQRCPANGDRIVAKLHDTNQVTFKVFTQDAGRCWLRPLNTDGHPPIFDAFTVIGKVIGKWEDD